MNRQKFRKAYESVRPDEEAQDRMLHHILLGASEIAPGRKDDTMKQKKMRPMMLVAIIVLVAAMTVTVFASEEISGWFKQYFMHNAEAGLTPGQLEYLDEHEKIVNENQIHNGYDLKLKSVLSDGTNIYATVGLTAPSDVTYADLKRITGSYFDFYSKNNPLGGAGSAWMLTFFEDMDGLENTLDMVFELTPSDWNDDVWTLRIEALAKEIYHGEYEQELRDTKYAGQSNYSYTQEEIEKIYEEVILAEGPWEFKIDVSEVERKTLELVTKPVTVQTCYGFKEDGTDLFEEINVTSFILSPLSATIQTDCDYAPDFCAGGRKIYVVMADGSRIELVPNIAGDGAQRFSAETPIILEDVAYVLLADGTKFMAP